MPSTAEPAAAGDLGGIHLHAWVFAAYMLTSTVTPPIQAKLADIYGRKRLMINGIVLFLCGSFLCGRAGGMATLDLFRALRGGHRRPFGKREHLSKWTTFSR